MRVAYKKSKLIKNPYDNFETEEHKIKIKLSFALYIFCCIFAPPLLPFNFLFLVAFFSFYKLLTKYKGNLSEVLVKSGLEKFAKLWLFVCFYIVLIIGINIIISGNFYFNNYAKIIYKFLLLIPLQLICIMYILARTKELEYNLKDFMFHFIFAGIIQSSIAIISLVSPSVKNILLYLMEKNTGSTVYYRENAYSYGYTYRYYGFSSTLLDTFGYGTGILVVLVIFLSICYKTRYFWFTPIIFIAPLLNSRTSLIIILLGLICSLPLLLNRLGIEKYIKIFFTLFLVSGILFFLYRTIYFYSPNTINWISDGIDSIISFILNREVERYSTADKLFSTSYWTLPEGANLLFGSGHSAYGLKSEIGFHSDVGYVNHLWLGGIFGLITIYLPFIYLFIKSLVLSKNNLEFWTSIFLALSYFIVMLKTDIIGYNPGIFITFSFLFFVIYNGADSIRKEEKYTL